MKRSFSVLVVVFLVMALASSASAQTAGPSTPPGGPYATSFTIQNLTSTDATCQYVLYNSSGASVFTSANLTVPANGLKSIYTPSVTGLPNGAWSGVVSCDNEAGVVANSSDSDSGASYQGFRTAETATKLYAPGLYKNYYGYYSQIVVQNTGSAAADIYASLYASGSTTPTTVKVAHAVPANASVTFDQSTDSALSSGFVGSAVLTSTQRLAAEVNIWGGTNNQQWYAYSAPSAGSTTAYAPVLFNNYYNYNTSLTVQNIGTASTVVTVTYGTGSVQTFTVGANASVEKYTPSQGTVPSGQQTTAKVVSSGQPILLLVNESWGAKNRAGSYIGFVSGATKSYAPIAYKGYYNWNTSINCMNIGTADTTMTITYANQPTATETAVVQANKLKMFYQPANPNLPNGYNGAATITSSGSQPIICVVNEDQNLNAATGDYLYVYNGLLP